MTEPSQFIRRFKGLRVLVVGDAILDVYERGTTDRLCREAPAPVVNLEDRVYSCGGAANTAVNTAALGADVSLLAVLGADANGDALLAELDRAGVSRELVLQASDRRTIAKKRICASANILVRVDEGDAGAMQDHLVDRVFEQLVDNAHRFDIIVLSDYECGIFTERLIEKLAKNRPPLPILVDAKQPARFRRLQPVAVKPNYDESINVLGVERRARGARVEQILAHGEKMLEFTGAQAVACTLDMDGTVLFERGHDPYLVSCVPQHDTHTIGAGDSFVGALALGIASGAPFRTATRLAAAAAAVVLEKDGTGICYADELRAHFRGQEKRASSRNVLAERVAAWRKAHKRIVFTNGCFDILHRGHVDFLQQARALGDVLVVAVNDDDGIRKLKGAGRPVNSLEDRMGVLGALESVDLLVSFAGESPIELLREIRPDVLAKGGTYSIDSLPEAEEVRRMGGDIEIIPFASELSTSELIHRIQAGAASRGAYGSGRKAL